MFTSVVQKRFYWGQHSSRQWFTDILYVLHNFKVRQSGVERYDEIRNPQTLPRKCGMVISLNKLLGIKLLNNVSVNLRECYRFRPVLQAIYTSKSFSNFICCCIKTIKYIFVVSTFCWSLFCFSGKISAGDYGWPTLLAHELKGTTFVGLWQRTKEPLFVVFVTVLFYVSKSIWRDVLQFITKKMYLSKELLFV